MHEQRTSDQIFPNDELSEQQKSHIELQSSNRLAYLCLS